MNESDIFTVGTESGTTPPAAPPSNSPSGGFNPVNLIRLILRRWLVVAMMSAVGFLLAILYIQWAPRLYKAESEIEMSIRRPRVINNEAVFEDSSLFRDEGVIFNTRFAKFRSPSMVRLTTEEYFERYPEDMEEDGKLARKYLLPMMIHEVHWVKDPKANIVRVSYFSDDPEFAARLVNVLSDCAGLLMVEENQAQSDEAVKWLVAKVDDKRLELDRVEVRLAKLRNEVQIDSLEQRITALGQALITVTGERETMISTLESRKTVYQYVLDLKTRDPNLEMLPPGLPKEEQLNEMVRNWRDASDTLLQVADRYTDQHPEYRTAAENKRRAKDRLDQFIEISAKAVENEIELLSKQLKQVEQRIQVMEIESVELEQQLVRGMQRLQRLEREREAADNSYQAMLRRMEEARLSADENMAFTKVIRKAEVPWRPVSPRRAQSLVIGVFFGGVCGCLLVLLIAFWTDQVASVTDLRQMGLNILGTIPPQKKVRSRSELATIGLRNKFCDMVEIFAGINALISSGKFSNKTKVLLMNSAMPGEGKTVCACNLAFSSAMNGAKTLLIDADLRRPQLASIFGVSEEHPSLLEWLVKNGSGHTHDQLVVKDVIENLDLVSSRPLREINPAELLGRSSLAELIEWAREEYDRIIIDSPPLGPVGDAQVLVNHVDSVIIVSRVGRTRRRALRFTLACFAKVDTFVLGCIANGVSHSISGMFGGGEGYGYGYKKYVSD